MIADEKGYRERVYQLVRQIPAGKVMTYGQIALILGEGYTPRTVGYVMHAASEENVPWQRVINSQGRCSTAKLTAPFNIQQNLLEQEGVRFSVSGKCELKTFKWIPDEADDLDDKTDLYA